MPADVLIYAIVAAGLVFWLRSLLGTRHGDERDRPNPFVRPPEMFKNQPAAAETAGAAAGMLPETTGDISAGLERNMSISGESAERGLIEIARADRAFELSPFLRGAQDAFIMIIEAFAGGDKETLAGLLHPTVFGAFEKVIDERAAKSQRGHVEIHAIRKAEVIEARIADKIAFITVRFTADETSIVRDGDDRVVFGDPERITETIDVWTFGRPLRARDPVWLLYETREDEGDELSGSTVPSQSQ